jgi:hypothetical protein
MATLSSKAKEILMAELELPVVSDEDLYGGKLVAALDRQHPRDLFDCMQLFAHGGITPAMRRAFVVYLACHNRPIHEVMFPIARDISQEYERTFNGMTSDSVSLEQLCATRERLMLELQQGLDENERRFLITFARNQPEFSLLDVPHLAQLPGIRWKLQNLDRLAKRQPAKLQTQAEALEKLLGC